MEIKCIVCRLFKGTILTYGYHSRLLALIFSVDEDHIRLNLYSFDAVTLSLFFLPLLLNQTLAKNLAPHHNATLHKESIVSNRTATALPPPLQHSSARVLITDRIYILLYGTTVRLLPSKETQTHVAPVLFSRTIDWLILVSWWRDINMD